MALRIDAPWRYPLNRGVHNRKVETKSLRSGSNHASHDAIEIDGIRMRPGLTPITARLGGKAPIRPVAAFAAALVTLFLGGVVFLVSGAERPPDYSLVDVRAGASDVPRAFLAGLPAAVLKDAEFGARKDIFVRTLLPLILRSNEAIQADRDRLLDLFEQGDSGEPLSRKERAWLSRLATRYGGSDGDLAALARRVDVIPPSLALAQAAAESGWGTSRFALQGNALFGLRTFRRGPALVPKEREAGAGFAVRRYAKLAGSVGAYMHNLNTHAAYREFRGVRAELRANGTVDARELLPALGGYAEDSGYVELIGGVMREGRFREFDRAVLANR